MSFIKTAIIGGSVNREQTLTMKPGGSSHTAYYQALELLEIKQPTINLKEHLVTCSMQEDNETVPLYLIISLERSIATQASARVSYLSTGETKSFELVVGEKNEILLEILSDNILTNNRIKVVVSGVDYDGNVVEFTKTLSVICEQNCNINKDVYTCISNSSQVLFRLASLGTNFKIKLGDDTVTSFTSLQELIAYLNRHNIIINFYKEVM